MSVKVGALYKHYKGGLYRVIALARHSETLEELVVYQSEEGERAIWVRPLEMFVSSAPLQGQERFSIVSEPAETDGLSLKSH